MKTEEYSAGITEAEYNYLIAVPCLRKHLLNRREFGECSFIGTDEQIEDMRLRLKGLYW